MMPCNISKTVLICGARYATDVFRLRVATNVILSGCFAKTSALIHQNDIAALHVVSVTPSLNVVKEKYQLRYMF